MTSMNWVFSSNQAFGLAVSSYCLHKGAAAQVTMTDAYWHHFRTESLRCQRLGFLVECFSEVQSCATKKNNQRFPVGAGVGNGACYAPAKLLHLDGKSPMTFVQIPETTTQGFKRFWSPMHQPFVSNIGCCLPRPISIPKMSGLQGNVWVRSIKREGLESKADVIVEAMEKAVG